MSCLASELAPGSAQFSPAIIVDSNIEEATGTSPDLAVSSTGQADVVYRVVETSSPTVPLLRPGDVVEQVRVAHFDGQRWSNLGAVNRDPGVSMRPPTQDNAPQIAIGPTGNGVVVWQEPDIEGVARIWARRLFGSTLDYVMPVSAETFERGADRRRRRCAERGGLVAGAGRRRLSAGRGAGIAAAGAADLLEHPAQRRIQERRESSKGRSSRTTRCPGGQSASVGPPSIDIDEKEDLRLLYDSNGTPRVIEGDDQGLTAALSLGPRLRRLRTDLGERHEPAGWRRLGVAERQTRRATRRSRCARTFPAAPCRPRLVSGGAGGEVGELAVGRSGLGDGLIAFRQGPFGNAAIVATQVTAPPAELIFTVPKGWVKPSQATITWQPAVSADGPLRYSVVLDGASRGRLRRGASSLRLDPLGLSSGRHSVQLLATDIQGQSTLSAPSPLLIAGPPSVKIARARGGYGVSVRVSDAYAGVDAKAVSVSFGDGHSARGHKRFTHRYAHGGVYRVVVHVRDKLGKASCRQPLGERAMRRLALVLVLSCRWRCWRSPSRLRPTSSARSRWSPQGRSSGVNTSRPNTRTTRRSPATGSTSRSTARSAASPACGGATCPPVRSNRSRAATPSCPRSAKTGSTSASRPTKA